MQSHSEFVLKLVRAAQAGENLAAVLVSERDHLLSCEQCQQAATALLEEAVGEAALLAELADDEEPALEPDAYPGFDFSFLESAATNVWVKGEQAGGDEANLPGQRRVLRHAIEILLDQSGARLGELVAALQTFRLSPVPVRGEPSRRPEGLTLEDPENDVRIRLRLSGHSQLNVLLSATTPAAGKPGRLVLVSTAQPRRTLQRLALKPGEEASLPLSPGDLIIQVAYELHTWEIPIQVR